ncbi:gas vesicle protein [Saccharomonospora xinjiangensis]|uniref:gas vesicle protein n=1 Tax=Saccharomonospora xinjiangensis TaxID=75294 RepID=UPI00106FA539|nr:gas vesicle protein [Saccharomonospora xinjiangensis]QBQ60254.1 Gas vesicle structural protein [Saccharomonospora xinjiangensis]
MTSSGRPGSALTSSTGSAASHQPGNLGDILERVLDKGLVIAGDIQVNLLDIELLTIKLRLVVASLETAKEVGINWWENDPWLTGKSAGHSVEGGSRQSALERENRELRRRIEALEAGSRAGQVEAGAPRAEDVIDAEAVAEERDE